jgi:hypothetical protein
MAWRIEENVVRGELDNRTRGRVDGTIWLADRTEPLVLHLIGNCHNDLAGCQLTFLNPAPKPDPGINLVEDQGGVVGDITAARKVRVIEDFDYLAIKAGKKLPEHLANCFYLEWFSEANGRVVIESTEYEIQVSEPAWRMSPAEETRQHEANAAAMNSFLERATGALDEREEAAYEGTPEDEFEWELFLRASDRRGAKLGELIEKYRDDPDCDRLIARAMGWTHIEEMLDAESAGTLEQESDDAAELSDPEPELNEAEEDDPIRHPLVARLLERSVALTKLVEDRQDKDVEEMLAGYMAVGPKVAGALGSVSRGIEEEDSLKGLVVAKLKRALGELSRALNAAERLKERKLDLPFQLGDWITEMFEIREELLSLMNQFRGVR